MTISVTQNQRISILKGNQLIAYVDDRGVPIITPKFFTLSDNELQVFWEMVNKFKVDY